jgi:hypothetical protein
MRSFKDYLEGNDKNSVVDNFLWHLSSPTLTEDEDDKELHEAFLSLLESVEGAEPKHEFHPETIVRRGLDKEQAYQDSHKEAGTKPASIRARIRDGFHAALDNDETDKERVAKARESYKHFRAFMAKEGGHVDKNKLVMTGQNGKTASSAGEGRNTIGLSLAPHVLGTLAEGHPLSGHSNVCPKASKECEENCLGLTAGGNRQYPETALRSKVLRQRYVMEHPEHAARILDNEVTENEKWTSSHHTLHDSEGNIVGHKNLKTGKIKSEKPPTKEDIEKGNPNGKLSHKDVADKLAKGELHEKKIDSGVRLNVTSDLQYHRLMPAKFFERHHNTKFYDYTKNTGTAMSKDLPSNYTVGLSHTGDNHAESNSHDVIKHLSNGGIAAMVYQRGKNTPHPKRVKVVGSKEGEHEWEIVDGDSDDNLDQRHEAAAKIHDQKAASATSKEEKEFHAQKAKDYRAKKIGVVSGLALKGVTNEKAGNFANKVDKDGTIWLHPDKVKKTINIASAK